MFSTEQIADITNLMEQFLDRNRPPEEIRKEVDLGYKIEDQNVFVFEIRPAFMDPKIIIESSIAKATYNKRQMLWKIYWMPGNLKWTIYDPKPTVKNLKGFIKLIEEDKYACFFG
ncbi:MAG: DUF3024 domain-containing protein [Chitinophagales bacterium]